MTVTSSADEKFKAFGELLRELGGKSAYIGVLASGKANEAHGDEDDAPTNVMVATIHEFGGGDVPERSFLRETLRLTKVEIEAAVAKRVRLALTGKIRPDEVHERTGIQVVGLCQEHIAQGISPPLKVREGTPLIDTGQLRASITYEVR